MFYIYIGCLTFGVLYSIISAVFGSHGFDHGGLHHAGIDIHGDADGADLPSPFNPIVIASAIATFGAVGLIGELGFKMGSLQSSLLAITFAGLVGALIFFGVVKLVYSSQSNSTFSLRDLEGIEAEVITPIPANGMGEIAYVVNGVRYNMSARSVSNHDIRKGEKVVIKEVEGNTAMVSRRITIEEFDMKEYMEKKYERKEEN